MAFLLVNWSVQNNSIMSDIKILDLQFLNTPHAIGSFFIESQDGLILIESGPESTYERLKSAIEKAGFNINDVKHVLLTHIHFDHAGAAWKFAKAGAKIYVHPKGYLHMLNPEKLWNSAKMIYGDDMENTNLKPFTHLATPFITMRIGLGMLFSRAMWEVSKSEIILSFRLVRRQTSTLSFGNSL